MQPRPVGIAKENRYWQTLQGRTDIADLRRRCAIQANDVLHATFAVRASEDRLRLSTGILSEPPVASVAILCLCRPLSSEATDCAESAKFRGLHFHLSLRW